MSTLLETVSQFDLLHRIGWGLIHSIWQIAVLAGIYLFARVLISPKRPAIRYRFGFCVLTLMAVVPVVTMFLIEPDTEKTTTFVATESTESAQPMERTGSLIVSYEEFMRDHVGPNDVIVMADRSSESDENVQKAVVSSAVSNMEKMENAEKWSIFLGRHVWLFSVGWFLGVIVLSLRLCSGLLAIRKLRRSGIDDIPEYWTVRLIHLCEKLGLKQKVRLFSSRMIDSPVLIGIVRPVILLPTSLLSGFTPEEVEAILAHELAHIRRHDYLANLVQMIIETLLFYHPFLWWVSNAIREDREYICDDFAVHRAGTDSLVYAKTLTHLEQFRQNGDKPMKRTYPTPAAAAKPLLARVRRVLGLKKESDRSCGWLAGITLSVLLLVTPVAWALMQMPANEPPKPAPFPAAEAPTLETAPDEQGEWKVLPQPPSTPQPVPVQPSPSSTFFGGGNTPISPQPQVSPWQGGGYATGQVVEGMPGRKKVTSGKPVTSKLYPIHHAMDLFTMEEFHQFLQKRLDMENLDDPYQIFMTRKNAMIIIGTDDLHKAIDKVMTEIGEIVASEEYLQSNNSTAEIIKVYAIRNSNCIAITNSLQIFFRDSKVTLTNDNPTNQILVKTDEATHELIGELITELDVKPTNPAANEMQGMGMSGGSMEGMPGGGMMGIGTMNGP